MTTQFQPGDKVVRIPGAKNGCGRRAEAEEGIVKTVKFMSSRIDGVVKFRAPHTNAYAEDYIHHDDATPAQRVGLAEGDVIRVTDGCDPSSHARAGMLLRGMLLRFREDDSSNNPYFTNIDSGISYCPHIAGNDAIKFERLFGDELQAAMRVLEIPDPEPAALEPLEPLPHSNAEMIERDGGPQESVKAEVGDSAPWTGHPNEAERLRHVAIGEEIFRRNPKR